MRVALWVGLLAACGGESNSAITIDRITPEFAPLSGGTKVVIEGQGFLRGGAPPNRVVFGDTEAPLAAAADDGTLEVIVPPGEQPGEVPVLVFNRSGSITAEGLFQYSTPPTIVDVSPSEVVFDTETTVTLTGTGFEAENAGLPTILINGVEAIDVQIVSDTQLSFTPRQGNVPFAPADVQLVNSRGVAERASAFRFTPMNTPAFVLFTKNSGAIFTIAYDPIQDVRVDLANSNTTGAFRAVVRREDGEFYAVNRFNSQFGRLDFTTQQIQDPVQLAFNPTSMIRAGTQVFAFDKNGSQFGTFDPTSGSFTPISTGVLTVPTCCGQQTPGGGAIATHNNNVVFSNGTSLSIVDRTTGQLSGTVNLTPARHIRGMRQLGNTLFGIESSGVVFTINTANGATANVRSLGTQVVAVELFEPLN